MADVDCNLEWLLKNTEGTFKIHRLVKRGMICLLSFREKESCFII